MASRGRQAVLNLKEGTLTVGDRLFEGEAAAQELAGLIYEGMGVVALDPDNDKLFDNLRVVYVGAPRDAHNLDAVKKAVMTPIRIVSDKAAEGWVGGHPLLVGRERPLSAVESRGKAGRIAAAVGGAAVVGLLGVMLARGLDRPPKVEDIGRVQAKIAAGHLGSDEVNELKDIRDEMLAKALKARKLPVPSSFEIDETYDYLRRDKFTDDEVLRMLLAGWTPYELNAVDEGIMGFYSEVGVRRPLIVRMPPSDTPDVGVMNVVPSDMGMVTFIHFGHPDSLKYLPEYSREITAHKFGHSIESIYWGATKRSGGGLAGAAERIKADVLKRNPDLNYSYGRAENYFRDAVVDSLRELRADALGNLLAGNNWLSTQVVDAQWDALHKKPLQGDPLALVADRRGLLDLVYAAVSAEKSGDSRAAELMKDVEFYSRLDGDANEACRAFMEVARKNWDYSVAMKGAYVKRFHDFEGQQEARQREQAHIRDSARRQMEEGLKPPQGHQRPPDIVRRH